MQIIFFFLKIIKNYYYDYSQNSFLKNATKSRHATFILVIQNKKKKKKKENKQTQKEEKSIKKKVYKRENTLN